MTLARINSDVYLFIFFKSKMILEYEYYPLVKFG